MKGNNEIEQRVAAVRRFNRLYTKTIGVLHEGILSSPFSLTEVRVLYELAHRKGPTATDLLKELGLDAGYLSRILLKFETRGFLSKKRSGNDGRQSHLSLTRGGQKAFASLDTNSREEIVALLGKLSPIEQSRLTAAMQTIEQLFSNERSSSDPYILRTHQPGDMGWIVHRHGVLYAAEYGWDEQFEALVAQVVADFIQHFDPKRERCWIAERYGEILGSVFLVKESKSVGKLRLLLVEPGARGLGIGKRLVNECLRFAQHAGYKKVTLWTNNVLQAARHIYKEAGFRLIHEEPHTKFGQGLIGETWELEFTGKSHAGPSAVR